MQRFAVVLLALTVALLCWNYFGMQRTLEISAASGHPVELRDDGGDLGASSASLSRLHGQLVLDCQLQKKFDWPYCGFFFPFGSDTKGVDLSQFDTVTIDLKHVGPAPHALRLYIRNFEPGLSVEGNWQTQKVNEIEFDLPRSGPIVIPLQLLRPAAWWLNARHVPLLHRGMRIDHVTAVELYTGGTMQMGQHRLVLNSLRFEGKLISQHHLLIGLVGMWIAFGMVWLTLGLVHFRHTLQLSKARVAALASINRALELETRELAGQAFFDSLTGALNRQGLRNMLLKHMPEAGQQARQYVVIFADIDHFKCINDQHGHLVGDAVLRHFSTMIQREIRSTDMLVRWGGEEFLIVCPATDIRSAHALGEKLRQAMALETWPAALCVTSSFGITAMRDGEDFGAAIGRADQALYRAKENGRNRVEIDDMHSSILKRQTQDERVSVTDQADDADGSMR